LLVVVFGVDQRAVTLGANEAFEVPVALSVKHQVLDMDGQVTTFADLSHRLSLEIVVHGGFYTLLALQTIFGENEFSLLVCQE